MCDVRGVTCEVGSGSYFFVRFGHHYAQLAVVTFDVFYSAQYREGSGKSRFFEIFGGVRCEV